MPFQWGNNILHIMKCFFYFPWNGKYVLKFWLQIKKSSDYDKVEDEGRLSLTYVSRSFPFYSASLNPMSNVEASNISPACYRLILLHGLKCIHFIFDTLIRDNFENFSNSTCNFSTTSVKIDLKPTFDFVVMLHSILNCSRIWCFSVLYLLLALLTI